MTRKIDTTARTMSDGKILLTFSEEIRYLEVTVEWAQECAHILLTAAAKAGKEHPTWERKW